MKLFKFCLLGLLLCSLFSCSKDDEDTSDNSALKGEWQLEEHHYQGTTTVTQENSVDESTYTADAFDINAQFFFNGKGDFVNTGSYKIKLVTTSNGESQTDEISLDNINDSGSYLKKGEKLFLRYDTANEEDVLRIGEYDIITLSESELFLEFSYEETSSLSGIEVKLVVEGYARYSI